MINLLYKEKNLIKLIKYGAITLVIILSTFTTFIFIDKENKELKSEITLIENNYMQHKKEMSQNLVVKFHKLIELEKETKEKDLKNRIKEQVNQAHAIATAIYKNHLKKPSYSKENALKDIKEAIRGIRFNNNLGYMFIYTLDGTNILNAEFPSLEGKNLWNYQDAKGTYLLQEMNKILKKKDSTFYEWFWKKPKERTKEYKKLGFFKKFEQYDLFIGTGIYMKDFEEEIKNRVLKKINSFELKSPEHLFIYDSEGLCLVNPKKELIGTNRINTKNKSGQYVLKDILNFTLKNKEGFVRYKGTIVLNEENVTNDKISFVKLFDEYQWVLGTGFYLEDLYRKIEKKKQALEKSNKNIINKILIFSFLMTTLIIIVSFYVSKVVDNIFNNYKNQVIEEMEKTIEKEKLLIQQSKMATMGEMIGNIAHQWKQPLSLISMSNTLLKINQENKNFNTKEEIDESILNIENSVAHLSETIDDFRDFFRPDKEKLYFNLEEALNSTYKLISSQFRNNNIKIIKDINDIEVYGYKNELLQVFMNIIKNAKDELVNLSSDKKRFLFIHIYKEENSAIIEIKDNAGGIPENIIDNIFDAYFTTKSEKEGTGIGLYMSSQIIQGMNGEIKVSNEVYTYEGEEYAGANFKIILPNN